MMNVYDIKKEKKLNLVFPLKTVANSQMSSKSVGSTLILMHLYYADSVGKHISYILYLYIDNRTNVQYIWIADAATAGACVYMDENNSPKLYTP